MIALTGATGQLGHYVLQDLLKTVPAGQIVAIVRNPAKAQTLSQQGVVVRQADYSDEAALTAALQGVDKLLLISSSEVGQRAVQHRNVINAAKAAGVKFIAYTSLLHADTSPLGLAQSTGSIADHLEPVALGIMAWTPSLLLAPFLAFFFLRDGRRFKRFLGSAVPNAFFEKTLFLLHEIDRTARAYFQGLINLTILDTVTLAAGLWLLGIPGPLALGLICAVLAWVPYVGSILGGLLVVLVAATDFPSDPAMAYWAIGLFGLVRLLDDFVYMPMTIGKSLELHPLVTVLMIFAGGAVAGVPGLMLVLPVLGVVMVIGETIGLIITDPRLMARHRHAKALRRVQASADL